MKIWQKILKGNVHSVQEIENEIETLKTSKEDMGIQLDVLKGSLSGLQKSLLADEPGSLEAVRTAESKISEFKNKIDGIKDVLLDLEAKQKEAEQRERKQRIGEINQEIKEIDFEADRIKKEILNHFSKAAVLVNKLVGNEREDHNLEYDFFRRCNLSTELSSKIRAGIDGQGLVLYTRKDALSRQRDHLNQQRD